MVKTTLADKMAKAEARKARAEQDIASLRVRERKARTRHLIEVGGLLAKAGIDKLPKAALYDRLLEIAEAAKDPKAVKAWERKGAIHFEKEEDNRVAAIATYSTKIDQDLTASLRSLGFKWNRVTKQWNGMVNFEEAQDLVEGTGGVIEEV